MDYLKNLNPEQLKVVNTLDGPILVLAGPGTGKTQLLSVRAAHIILQKKALPENILILTFTNSAARTMKERLASIIGEEGFNVEVSTYHSFARNYIILDSEEAARYIGERVQIEDVEKIKAVEYILDTIKGVEALRPFGAPYTYRAAIEKKISELKNEGVSPQEFQKYVSTLSPDGVIIEEKHLPRLKALAKVYAAYEELKSGKTGGIFDKRGRFDYDDMILVGTEILKKEKALRGKYQDQYKYIMVDEFQDSNGAQLDMLFCLVNPKQPNICCVGDDDQSIYRFQGANIENFRHFRKKFPQAAIISLKANYRSSSEILDLSAAIIKNIPREKRFETKSLIPKITYSDKSIEFYEFTTEHEELLFLVKKLKELARGIEKSSDIPDEERQNPYNNIAMLVRKRSYILKLIDALLAAGIPYSTDGKEDISREKRVRQLLNALELAHINMRGAGEEDLTLFKVLTSDYLGIPVEEVLAFITRSRKRGPGSLLAELLKDPPKKFEAAAGAISRLIEDARNKPVHSVLMQYIHDAGIYHFLLNSYDKNKILRLRDLRAITSFLNIVKAADRSKPGLGLDEFMDQIKTRQEHNIPLEGELVTLSQNGVRIYTAHGAKGQEFHTVIIPFCIQDKSWPLRPQGDKLPLPAQIYKRSEKIDEKEKLKQLMQYDETRLFYVALSRAKANLIFTASPQENNIPSFYLNNTSIKKAGHILRDEGMLLLESLDKSGEDELSLAVTTGAVKSAVKEMVLTPTKVNNYLKCRRKFFYDDVLRLPGRKRPGLVFGSCCHKALEETYKKFMASGRFPDFKFFSGVFTRELKFQGADRSIEKGCFDKLATLKGWFEDTKKKPIRPVGLEKKIMMTLGDGIPFVGKYDKLEPESEKSRSVRVIDYKTGKPDKYLKAVLNFDGKLEQNDSHDYLRQLASYKMLIEHDKSGPERYSVGHGMLVFLEPIAENAPSYGLKKGSFKNAEIKITDDMTAALDAAIKEVWAGVQALAFDKLAQRDESKCGNCEFDSICWPV